MNKADVLLLKAFLWGLPLVILLASFSSSYDEQLAASAGDAIRLLYDFAGWIFGIWMILSMYLSVRLLFSEKFREKVLTKLTFIKEREEREVMLTGQAAKTTMLTTVAMLLFLFCLSCFQIGVKPDSRIFAYNGLPISSSSVMIGLMLWQMMAYNNSMRKFMK